jgi:predicted nuclease with TOPRIM domain
MGKSVTIDQVAQVLADPKGVEDVIRRMSEARDHYKESARESRDLLAQQEKEAAELTKQREALARAEADLATAVRSYEKAKAELAAERHKFDAWQKAERAEIAARRAEQERKASVIGGVVAEAARCAGALDRLASMDRDG